MTQNNSSFDFFQFTKSMAYILIYQQQSQWQMKTAMKIALRNNLEQRIVDSFKKINPNMDQYFFRMKMPLMPKVVIYSNNIDTALQQQYLDQVFPLYKYVTPAPETSEDDQSMVKRIASLLSDKEFMSEEDKTYNGYLIKGFPFNTKQALLFDRELSGVNLAIELRDPKQSSESNTPEIEEILRYYNERGTLLRLNFEEQPSSESLELAYKEVVSHMKNADGFKEYQQNQDDDRWVRDLTLKGKGIKEFFEEFQTREKTRKLSE